jgi:2,3-bisphosphoglycerate-independent phosphoglycerate mutase
VPPFIFGDFNGFERGHVFKNLFVATMTDYDDTFKVRVAYPPEVPQATLGEVLSKKGLTQFRIAEGEKEAHVTNFFNGGKLGPYPMEERVIAKSRPLMGEGYLKHPEMSTHEITDNILKNIDKSFSLMVVNIASTDMIAHTGNIPAAEKALRIVDKSIEKIVKEADLSGTAIIITADHGNVEEMVDPSTGENDTQHSTANVPVIFISDKFKDPSERNLDNLYQQNPIGSLIDIAPTVLAILGIEKPKEMSGSRILS